MVPSPTVELMLVLSLVRIVGGKSPKRCSKVMHGMVKVLGASNPKVRRLREAVPTLEEARLGGKATLAAACAVCPSREKCKDPLDMT